jgi:hypothetical protein
MEAEMRRLTVFTDARFVFWRLRLAGLLLAGASLPVLAQQIEPLQTAPVQRGDAQAQGQQQDNTGNQSLQLTARDRAIAQMWNLSDDEMLRAKLLLLGPRGSFSVPGISPVEALGIHARSDAERQKYAELFARIQYADVQRVLAFQRAYDAAIGQLTSGQPMVSFKGLPKVDATEGAAEFMHVPRSQLTGGQESVKTGAGQP